MYSFKVALHARAGIETNVGLSFADSRLVALHARAGIETCETLRTALS